MTVMKFCPLKMKHIAGRSCLCSPDAHQMRFCPGSANVGNSAAIEAPVSADAAVEQIPSVCCGLRAAVAAVQSSVVRISTNLASPRVAGAT